MLRCTPWDVHTKLNYEWNPNPDVWRSGMFSTFDQHCSLFTRKFFGSSFTLLLIAMLIIIA